MSVASEKVRKAIFAKSNVGTIVGSGKLTGIYEGKAPKNSSLPYGVFFRQAGDPVQYSLAQTSVVEGDIWTFKVLADIDSVTGSSKEPQEFAEDMLNAWETLLGNTLTLSGKTVAWMARYMDIPPIDETPVDRYIYQRGFMMRIKTE